VTSESGVVDEVAVRYGQRLAQRVWSRIQKYFFCGYFSTVVENLSQIVRKS
jgi:hypothetical protein